MDSFTVATGAFWYPHKLLCGVREKRKAAGSLTERFGSRKNPSTVQGTCKELLLGCAQPAIRGKGGHQ